ncbi:MAG: family 43 glycosylhydrolase [Bacteroidaceae bacterium]|nr:family 43 glycosylhydrolase [Bacteroidaceae bacterium]
MKNLSSLKRVGALMAMLVFATIVFAQGVKLLPTLHVDGRWLVDEHGNHVVLHGVMDTPSAWFNNGRWGWSYDDAGRQRCIDYFEKLFKGLEEAHCTVFRLHLEPAWTNDGSITAKGFTKQDGKTIDPLGNEVGGEADISHFSEARLRTYLTSLYFPLMQRAMNHGMYVVVRPPGVCPGKLQVGDYYQQYLLKVWDIFTQNNNIKKYAGQISIELANEPVSLKNAEGQDDPHALHDYFQPVVDKIRSNGFTGIVWAPGTGWQANYTDYGTFPIEGPNIGYAVHDYCGWYGCSDATPDPTNKINQFRKQVPVVDTAPIIITEVDWSPKKEGTGHYNEHGEWVESNWGTWATGSTSKWGKAFKALLDHYGNISMTLSGTGCLIDIDTLIDKRKVVPAFDGLEEACGKACMDWYADYYNKDWPHADFKNVSVSDQGGRYKNPVIFADFPDPDVIRVGDTYYMVSTTMHHFPGATILKSTDLVNWDYCAQPLTQLASTDRYNLMNDKNAYAAGMWACSMKYHDGKFYLLINGNDTGGWLLTATDPEGRWEKRQLSRIYYDPGMLFDNGKVYVACGIGNIQMCELDENFNFIREQRVISDKSGLEGCHLYKIGDYYYIYATYGGWPSGQAVFRSKNIFGPYEEKMLVEKTINGKPNTVHQGALIDTPTGEWWTILQEDLGCMGRMPNLQPVKWTDDWPVVGNKGVPYAAYNKPATAQPMPRHQLPTNDNFRSYPLGQQWEWNHNPLDGAWSLFERPGWLRLRTSEPVSRLTQARNMLTQRTFAFHDKESTPTTGTVRLDVSHLQEGDRAGICVFQDPYAYIAVEVKDGQRQLVWRQDTLRTSSSFTPAEKVQAIDIDSVIYLRASVTKSTSKTRFSYSLDNATFMPFGDETTLGYSLTVFVGARFGLFCYATQPGTNGYADFDWFSTEADFDESTFYPATFEGYNADMLTATELKLGTTDAEIMVGNSTPLQLTATFADGHTDNVAAQTQYNISGADIVTVQGGQLRGIGEGTANVTAIYTDPMGNEFTTSFTVRSTFFPFAAKYINPNLFATGSYNERTHTFRPGQWGQMGWEYPNGADMSAYKYLVIKLKIRQSCSAHLNIFTSGSIWGDSYQSPDFGTSKQIVIDLSEAKYTNGNRTGEPLDTKNIRIVDFWGNGSGTIVVDEMYLTNNDDYSPQDAIGDVEADSSADVPVYSLSGQLLRSGSQGTKGLSSLRPGIYIVGGKKVVVK